MESLFLSKIVAARRRRVEEAKARLPLESLRHAAESRSDYRDFPGALSRAHLGVIAELKRASPSRGLICAQYEPRKFAEAYERAGAAAISVLTEKEFFQGSLDDLKTVRQVIRLPVLRKDFIVDDYQVYESAAAGADALLLIVAALAEIDLKRLIEIAGRLKIAPLVEVHTELELERALAAGAHIIGVNNRDLRTFEVRLETSFRLREKIPASCIAIAESGIKSGRDLEMLASAGFNAALIGEHLMSSGDPGRALEQLLERAQSLRMART